MPEIFEGGKVFLKLDEKLHPGDYLVSPDRKSKAILQDDGNFVVRDLRSHHDTSVMQRHSKADSVRQADA